MSNQRRSTGRTSAAENKRSVRRLAVAGLFISGFFTAAAALRQQAPYSLIFVQVPAGVEDESPAQTHDDTFMDRCRDGSRIVKLPTSGGRAVVLTSDFVGACDPDVSFDGTTIVFAGKRSAGDSWQIWTMAADGSNKTQVTHGHGTSIAPTYAGSRFYLNDPQPTPQIIFATTRAGWRDEVTGQPLFSLYGTDLAGDSIHRLTFNLHSDYSPDVLPTGRVVFSSWQLFGDRYAPDGIVALMAINIDGTDLMPFYGNHEMPRYKNMVHVSDWDDRVYFVEADRLDRLGGGDISYVSSRRPLHSYRRVADAGDGRYHSPTPLPNGGLLASYRANGDGDVFGIYEIDAESGSRRGKIFEEPGWHSIDIQVLAPHPTAKGRSNWLRPGSTTGVFYCLNSYRTDLNGAEEIPSGTIKHVRVIEGLPSVDGGIPDRGRSGSRIELRRFTATNHGPRRLLGVAPVEDDGSFQVRVPAETPITFQLLGEDFMALRTQEAWTWVIGNENRGCIGCHEDRELSPPNRMVDAVIKPPVDLTLPAARRRTVDFRHEITPIIESRCATGGCHVAGAAEPDLARTKRNTDADAFSPAYITLLDSISRTARVRYVVPGSARESPVIWLLTGRHTGSRTAGAAWTIEAAPSHDVLDGREKTLFIEWIDLGAQWDSRAAIRRDSHQSPRE